SKDGVVNPKMKNFGGGGFTDSPTAGIMLSDSRFIIAGITNSIGNGSGRGFVSSFDTSGIVEWVSYIGSGEPPEKIIANENGYAAAGRASANCDFSQQDFYFSQMDFLGLNNCQAYVGQFNIYDTTSIVSTPNIIKSPYPI